MTITSIWLLGVALTIQVPPPQAAGAEASALRDERQAIRERETRELKASADRCRAAGRDAEAEWVLSWIEPPPPLEGPMRFVPLPEVAAPRDPMTVPAEAAPPGAKPAVRDLDEAHATRARAADALFALAVRALSGATKHYSLADTCLRAVLDRQPDHPEARRLMGYVPYAGGWATPFAVHRIKNGMVEHRVYGWVDSSWVAHLDRGELPAPGFANAKQASWLRAADADALRNSIEHPWQIETDHFVILTDVPLSEAIAFGRKLEAFHDLFFSLLADVIADDLPLARRSRDKGKTLPRSSPHTIYYFADRGEYVEFLRPNNGVDVEESLGFYDPPQPGKRRAPAYFFRDPDGQLDVTSTLFHEVSHQLLFESTSVGTGSYKKNVGNYWVFEGLGTYFETVAVQPDGTLRVGDFVGPRIEVARDRLLDRAELVPVERLVRLGQNGFNDRDRVHLHYAESMALCVFLMDGHGGRYRAGFLDYVRDALRGRLRGTTGRALEDRLGISYRTIEADFLAALGTRKDARPSR